MQPIEVIDTAVKVGLGALISGYATYKVSKLNHHSEANKEHRKRLHDTLFNITEMIDCYTHAMATCVSKIDGILRHGTEPGTLPEKAYLAYIEADNELIKVRPNLSAASSRLGLLGFIKVKNAIYKLQSFENKLRLLIVFDKKLPSQDTLIALRKELGSIQEQIQNELRNVYKAELG